MQQTLTLAREIQTGLLPKHFPDDPRYTLAARMITAKEVGGDFYDVIPLGPHRVGFAIGDVAGKGVPAALFMAVSRTVLRSLGQSGRLSPGETLTRVNALLHPESARSVFVTVVYGILDARTGVVDYAVAGHNPPYRVPADGPAEPLERTGGIGLALTGDFAFATHQIQLAPGDALLLYTDGVTEAANPDGELFGDERLEAELARTGHSGPEARIRGILEAVDAFAEGAPQHDDITLLALCYAGLEAAGV